MAKLIPRVGARLVGLHHRLILVIPELSKTAFFLVSVTKPNRSQYIIQIKNASTAHEIRESEYLNLKLEMTEESP